MVFYRLSAVNAMESNKISGNYYLTELVYIVNDEIQYYLIVRLISGDKI